MQEYRLQNKIQLHVGWFCGDRHHMTSEEKEPHHLVYTEKVNFLAILRGLWKETYTQTHNGLQQEMIPSLWNWVENYITCIGLYSIVKKRNYFILCYANSLLAGLSPLQEGVL